MVVSTLKVGDWYKSASGLSYQVQAGQTQAVTSTGVVKIGTSNETIKQSKIPQYTELAKNITAPIKSVVPQTSQATNNNFLIDTNMKLNNIVPDGTKFQIPTAENINKYSIGIGVTPDEYTQKINELVKTETQKFASDMPIQYQVPSIWETIFGKGEGSGSDTIKNNIMVGAIAVAAALLLVTIVKK